MLPRPLATLEVHLSGQAGVDRLVRRFGIRTVRQDEASRETLETFLRCRSLPRLTLQARLGEEGTRVSSFAVDLPANGVIELPEELPLPAPTEALRLVLTDAAGLPLSDNFYPPGYFTP